MSMTRKNVNAAAAKVLRNKAASKAAKSVAASVLTQKGSRERTSRKASDATIADYEAVLRDHDRLVRELDIAMSGKEGAAKQASLCDLVAWADEMGRRGLLPFPDIRNEPNVIAGMAALNVLRAATPNREIAMIDLVSCFAFMATEITKPRGRSHDNARPASSMRGGHTLLRHHSGPWHVRDMRSETLRKMGWTGPAVDRILITTEDGYGIMDCEGHNCVVARIQFDNRPDELGESNMADARLMASAPELFDALAAIMRDPRCKGIDPAHRAAAYAALDKASKGSDEE